MKILCIYIIARSTLNDFNISPHNNYYIFIHFQSFDPLNATVWTLYFNVLKKYIYFVTACAHTPLSTIYANTHISTLNTGYDPLQYKKMENKKITYMFPVGQKEKKKKA